MIYLMEYKGPALAQGWCSTAISALKVCAGDNIFFNLIFCPGMQLDFRLNISEAVSFSNYSATLANCNQK